MRGPDHTVRLIVDFGDGFRKEYSALAWSKDMTVLNAMELAKSHPRGITFVHTGSGATALLSQIDDAKNEGGRGGKRNWTYWVNTTFGDKSFGSHTLDPRDVVLWKYSTQGVDR